MLVPIMFVTGIFFFRKRKMARLTVVLWFLAGCGASAWIVSWFQTGAGWLTSAAAVLAGPITILVGVSWWAMLEVGHDMNPRDKSSSATRSTAVFALLLPLILTAVSWPVGDAVLSIGHGILEATKRAGVV